LNKKLAAADINEQNMMSELDRLTAKCQDSKDELAKIKKFAAEEEKAFNKLKKEFSNSDRTISELKNQISAYCDNLNQKALEKKQLSTFIDKL